VPDKDDFTSDDLIQREDDHDKTIRTRLDIHHAQTKQLAEYYSGWADTGDSHAPKYRKVDGSGSIGESAIVSSSFLVDLWAPLS
jgi:adenylate kinase